MSNPAVFLLAETKIQGKNIRIEDNLGEAIHIHIGDFRFSLSINEFLEISSKILDGVEGILETNNLSLDMFDVTALDWGWLARYSEIESVKQTTVLLGDLLTIEEVEGCQGITKIVPLSEAPKLRELHKMETGFQREKGRLLGTLEKIKKDGYPFDNKLIMINQYNQIYDGDHRAACLMYLYGSQKQIPVMQVFFSDEKTMEEQYEIENNKIREYKKKNSLKKNEKKYWSEEENILDISLKEFVNELISQNIDYFIINCAMKNQDEKVIADKVVIIQQNKMIDMCKALKVSYYGSNFYRYYQFLYSMQRGVNIKLNDSTIMVFDRVCCKSKFENAFIPLDKKIQNYVWDEIVYDKENSLYVAGTVTTLIFVLVNGIFNKNKFDEEDIKYIQKNSICLNNSDLISMLKSILFSFTDKFIELIMQNNYEMAITKHIENTDY